MRLLRLRRRRSLARANRPHRFVGDHRFLHLLLGQSGEAAAHLRVELVAQAEVVGACFDLSDEAVAWLQIVPYKGSLPTAVPTDPLIYRWYEIVSVYGSTIKELIHEEFGDGIMSAIDFSMDIQREPDPKGDRVNVVLSGKFLPYKSY